MLDDATYFGWRAYEETRAWIEAVDPRARAAHFEMARRYHELAEAITTHDERLGVGGGPKQA